MEPGRYSKQKLVLGTHTSENEQNYLMLAEARVPTITPACEALYPYHVRQGPAHAGKGGIGH